MANCKTHLRISGANPENWVGNLVFVVSILSHFFRGRCWASWIELNLSSWERPSGCLVTTKFAGAISQQTPGPAGPRRRPREPRYQVRNLDSPPLGVEHFSNESHFVQPFVFKLFWFSFIAKMSLFGGFFALFGCLIEFSAWLCSSVKRCVICHHPL